jgi:hypothetical protein
MPTSAKQLREQGFDRDAYLPCSRWGVWDARVDATAYSRGARTGKNRKGKWAGINLYLRAEDDGRKYWLFAYLYTTSGIYHSAKELNAGDRVQVKLKEAEFGHAWLESLVKLRPVERPGE